MRDIELNPVRAAMVDDPAHSRWTSYRANTLGQFSPPLSPHPPVHLALGATDSARRVAYRSLFRPHLDAETITDLRLALTKANLWATSVSMPRLSA